MKQLKLYTSILQSIPYKKPFCFFYVRCQDIKIWWILCSVHTLCSQLMRNSRRNFCEWRCYDIKKHTWFRFRRFYYSSCKNNNIVVSLLLYAQRKVIVLAVITVPLQIMSISSEVKPHYNFLSIVWDVINCRHNGITPLIPTLQHLLYHWSVVGKLRMCEDIPRIAHACRVVKMCGVNYI